MGQSTWGVWVRPSATAHQALHFNMTGKDWERLIPAANMGEYEPPRERPEDGGLYPLNAEGTYGRVPKNRNPGRQHRNCPSIRKGRRNPNYMPAMLSVISASCMLSC